MLEDCKRFIGKMPSPWRLVLERRRSGEKPLLAWFGAGGNFEYYKKTARWLRSTPGGWIDFQIDHSDNFLIHSWVSFPVRCSRVGREARSISTISSTGQCHFFSKP